MSRIGARVVGIASLLGTIVVADGILAEEPDFVSAIRLEDLDLQRTRLVVGGHAAPVEPGVLKTLLALPGAPTRSGPSPKRSDAVWQLQVVFRAPQELGTLLVQSGDRAAPSASVLRPDFAGEPEAAVGEDWIAIGPRHVFEPGAKVRAVRLVGSGEGPNVVRLRCRLLRTRLASLTPEAVGSGEKAPFGSHPDSLPRGHAWVNTASDPSPGAAKQIRRGPVSDVLPSWYVLSWERPRTVQGAWIVSTAKNWHVSIYRGDPRGNPALAVPRDWVRIPTTVLSEVPGEDDLTDRLVACEAVETRAIRFDIVESAKGAVAEIRRFDALSDLGAAPLPPPSGSRPSPFAIPYVVPTDGQLAMVVADGEGRTVRNLVAQVDRTQGPAQEEWDLKDEAGRTVAPGTYRWKAIVAPPLELHHRLSVYPNVAQLFPDRLPWLTGETGPNGWLADHSSPTSGAAFGDRVFFGAPVVESGVSLIECDREGRKLWGKHGFAGFTGPARLAADSSALYVLERDNLLRMDPATHDFQPLGKTTTAGRAGKVTGMAAHDGKLFVAFHSPVPWLDDALRAADVDLDQCLPLYPKTVPDLLGNRRVEPNPRAEFLRLLRLTGTPPGQGDPRRDGREPHFPIDLETVGDAKAQYLRVAFRTPVPLGSVVLPCPGPEFRVELAVLKPNVAPPGDVADEKSWLPFPVQPKAGWTCVAAPEGASTRALRVRVVRADSKPADPLDDLLEGTKGTKNVPDLDGLLDKSKRPTGSPAAPEWFVRIEGMKLLRRRFADAKAAAKIRTNSGAVDARGAWDAQRTEPLSEQKPGIYVLEWSAAEEIAGLAIKEIDGARTAVDVWEGAGDGPVPLEGEEGWRNVATYVQPRRDAYQPSFNQNDSARYLDGYVDFGAAVRTRAVRLRVLEQWSDNNLPGTDRATASNRRDRGGRALDPRRCRIDGVVPLRPLGGEPEVDRLAYRRIEVRDGRTGTLLRDLPVAADRGLATGPRGELYGIESGRVLRIDPETGAASPVLPDIDGEKVSAQRLAVGPDGMLFVYVLPEKVVRVHRPGGELVRTLGHPGGQRPGPWDPEKFLSPSELVVDSAGSLWVVENQHMPRRIVKYRADGAFDKEILGNTNYGGGGVLDPGDPTRLFFHSLEFAIDPRTGRSRIRNLLADHLPEDCVPVRFEGRTYLATAPLSYRSTQSHVRVFLLDEQTGTTRPVAAFGEAEQFGPAKKPAILALMAPGRSPVDHTFVWADRNGDGSVDADEIVLEPKIGKPDPLRLGRCNERLVCRGGHRVYRPREILADGTPVFAHEETAAAGLFELTDGRVLDLNGRGGDRAANLVRDAAGRVLWSYPVDYPGVSGLFLPPWRPGYVTNEFGVIGHAVETRGDLGEFVVVHANNGMWKIWTADGLLAGTILGHKFDRATREMGSFRETGAPVRFDGLSAGQEHFHGFFARNAADGRAHIVHGHNLITVTEVVGLDRFRRLSGEIVVAPEDVRRVRTWEEELARREVQSQARLLECVRTATGGQDLGDVAELDGVRFAFGHDERNLYLRWKVSGHGPLRNTGSDFRRWFKTGAAVDLHLGTDPQADPARRRPARGDLRLLITAADGKPAAVLYQPVFPGAAPTDAWETRTEAGGTTSFDRVVRLSGAKLSVTSDEQNGSWTLTASVPLEALGLTITPGLRLPFDWGILASDDGATVKRRIYWSNTLANGTTDEAIEARLEPHLWGTAAFVAQSADERRLSGSVPALEGGGKPAVDAEDLLRDLDRRTAPDRSGVPRGPE